MRKLLGGIVLGSLVGWAAIGGVTPSGAGDAALTRQIRKLTNRVGQVETDLASTRDRLSKTEEQIAGLEGENASLAGRVQTLEGKAQMLDPANGRYLGTIDGVMVVAPTECRSMDARWTYSFGMRLYC